MIETDKNVAQPIFCQNQYITCTVENLAQKFGLLLLFSKNCQNKTTTQLVKIPQSGHSGSIRFFGRFLKTCAFAGNQNQGCQIFLVQHTKPRKYTK
jgi:hypothetical protein